MPGCGDLLEWADVVLVMEEHHRRKVVRRFRNLLRGKKVGVLGTPDVSGFMDSLLVALLKARTPRYVRIDRSLPGPVFRIAPRTVSPHTECNESRMIGGLMIRPAIRLLEANSDTARKLSAPYVAVGPTLIAVSVVLFGLLYWIVCIFTLVPFGLDVVRKVWLWPVAGQLTVFATFTVTCILFGYWVLFDLLRYWILCVRIRVPVLVMYMMCLNVPLAVGYDLYKMRKSVLDDEWFTWALETEDIESRLTFVARILDLPPGNCTGRTPSPCVTIELEDGRVVLAHLPAIPAKFTTDVVVVDLMVGAKTGVPAYYEVWDYMPGDPEMTWNSVRGR